MNTAKTQQPATSPWQRPARLLMISGIAVMLTAVLAGVVRLLPVPELASQLAFEILLSLIPTGVLLAAYSSWVRPSPRGFWICAVGCFLALPLGGLHAGVQQPTAFATMAAATSLGSALVLLWTVIRTVMFGAVRLVMCVIDWRLGRAGKPSLSSQWELWWEKAAIEERISALAVIFAGCWLILSWSIEAIPVDDNAFSRTVQAALLNVAQDGKAVVLGAAGSGLLLLAVGWGKRVEKENAKQRKKLKKIK